MQPCVVYQPFLKYNPLRPNASIVKMDAPPRLWNHICLKIYATKCPPTPQDSRTLSAPTAIVTQLANKQLISMPPVICGLELFLIYQAGLFPI